jgi:hypothetical protein
VFYLSTVKATEAKHSITFVTYRSTKRFKTSVKLKVKVHPITDPEGPRGGVGV